MVASFDLENGVFLLDNFLKLGLAQLFLELLARTFIPMAEQTLNICKDPEVEARLKRVVQRIYDLPSFPEVIQKLQEVAEDPNSTSKKLADVMEKDQGLSAKILKLVNSAFYSFSKPVSSLQHAITLLGYNSIRSLAMSVSMKSLLKVEKSVFHAEHFWEHALAVGVGTRMFAEMHKFPLREDAFTAGLMHDVGILLEAKYFPEELAKVVERARSENQGLVQVENEQLGVDHCLLGAWLAERWRLPLLLAEPMLKHHILLGRPLHEAESESMEAETLQVLEFVTVANHFANLLALGHGLDQVRPEEEPTEHGLPEHLLHVMAGKSLEDVLADYRERFEASRAFLSV